jgi:eukaryotic-like serine/threonine-protein kinase
VAAALPIAPDSTLVIEAGVAEPAGPSLEESQAILNAGIQDITGSLVGDYALADILRIIIETMYRGIGFQHVLLCIKDARQKSMVAKFGFGPDVEEIIQRFRFPLGGRKDIFDVALSRGADILISDIRDPKISSHIPEWFSRTVAAETFILFPLVIKNAPVGLIYADKARAGELVIPENILSMLRALRNQAVLAIKQSR